MSSWIGSVGGHVPQVHPEAWIAPGAVVVGRVTLGRAANIWYGSVLRADDDEIVVGAECNIQDLCCLHVDEGEPAVLGDRVSVGHHATVHGAHVDGDALIGIGAVVLGRARIGAGTLVAAGTVIRPGQQVPAGELTDADRATFADTPAQYVARAAGHRAASWRDGPGHPQ
jgi:carbonic anhydrase/acetyltransferase-like protein (isoleucine patch superfamily)